MIRPGMGEVDEVEGEVTPIVSAHVEPDDDEQLQDQPKRKVGNAPLAAQNPGFSANHSHKTRQPAIGPHGLTMRQTNFVKCLLDGMNQSDAYRASYDTTDWQDNSIHNAASVLMRHPKIRASLMDARHEAGRLLKITVQSLTDMALEAFEVGKNAGKASDMNASVQTLAKLNGLMVERSERKVETVKRGDREALEAEVRRLCSSLGIKVLDAKADDDTGTYNVVDVQDDSTQ